MSLSPRAIALQGIGYGALLVALQGLVGVTVVQPVEPPVDSRGTVRTIGTPVPMRISLPASRRLREEEEIIAFIAAVLQSGLMDPQ